MATEIFVKKSDIQAPAGTAFKWHEKPGALQRLTPPWQNMKVLQQSKGIPVGATVTMVNYFFGFPVKMEAEHLDYKKGTFFQDTLTKSPFSSWVHNHSFFEKGEEVSELEDKIEYRLPWYFPRFLKTKVKKELHRIFNYRHAVFQKDIERQAMSDKPLTILLSGASGLLGAALIPFFTTGGHKVLTLVRRTADPLKNEISWDPAKGELDLDGIGKIDVVINLNGSPIAEGRWTEERKKRIIESRTASTLLLAEKIAALTEKPDLFFSASAIGYYGDTGNESVDEKGNVGDMYISDVCNVWEESAEKAVKSGVRTVFGRIGVVLTPRGGALEKMLPSFYFGMGGRLSTGSQYMSCISLEDIIGSIWHIIMTPEISGPVNLVNPTPVTNKEFTKTIGKVLSKPAFFIIPSWLINLIWGKMGKELLLSGAKAEPAVLKNTGYVFCHETLEDALRAELGR